MNVYKEIASNLYYKYYNYYCTVFFDFIVEAVQNTIKDYQGEVIPLDEMHQYIKENYI